MRSRSSWKPACEHTLRQRRRAKRLLAGGYAFPELARLTEAERVILLDAAELLFLEPNVCFRETDPLLGENERRRHKPLGKW